MKILLIDDEESMQTLVEQILVRDGYEFCCAGDGEAGLELLGRERSDLVILDIMMPRMNGFQVCREIRERGIIVPVIFLSARNDIIDKSEGFEAGGNDYLVKPFDPQELSLRVKAHLRQFAAVADQRKATLVAGSLEMDVKRHCALVDGTPVDLTAKEFQILYLLASYPGEVFTREQLVAEAWGREFVGETSSIAVFIRKIREKIEVEPSNPQYVITVRNVGYKFAPPGERSY